MVWGKRALQGQKHLVDKHTDRLIFMLLPLQGALIIGHLNPGRCPGLGAGCPFGARQH